MQDMQKLKELEGQLHDLMNDPFPTSGAWQQRVLAVWGGFGEEAYGPRASQVFSESKPTPPVSLFRLSVLGVAAVAFGLGIGLGLFVHTMPDVQQTAPTPSPSPSSWVRLDGNGPWRFFDGDHRVVCYASPGRNPPSIYNATGLSCVHVPYEIFSGIDLQDDAVMEADDTALPNLE